MARRSARLVPVLTFLVPLCACVGGGGESASPGTEIGQPGALRTHPDASIGSLEYVVETNQGGQASSMSLLEVRWGRLAEVSDVDGLVVYRDYLVGEDIVTDGEDYEVSVHPITGTHTVRILHTVASSAFDAAFQRLDDNLIPILPKGLGPEVLPPFSLAPRNSALALRFDDLLGVYFDDGVWRDFEGGNLISPAGQIRNGALQVRVGNPPVANFGARIVPDPNHGDVADFDGDGELEFFPTRLLVDPAVSELEAAGSPELSGGNALGLPPSVTTQLANVALRIPTVAIGTQRVLHNPSGLGHTVEPGPGDAVDPTSPSLDLIRALRSGGPTDANNGFLRDDVDPSLIGSQAIAVTDVAAGAEPGTFEVAFTFDLGACALFPEAGDVVRQSGRFFEVTGAPAAVMVGTVTGLPLRVLFPFDAAQGPQVGPALFQSTFEEDTPDEQIPCFLSFSPPPAGPPASGLAPGTQITARFSEPLDPTSVRPFDTFSISRVAAANDPSPFDRIVGELVASPDRRAFTFVPSLPLSHTAGATETYYCNLRGGADGVTDLAGNALETALPEVDFRLLTAAPSETNGGLVLRFDEFSELDNEAVGVLPAREVRGQLLFDEAGGRLLPRPVNRFSVPHDRSQGIPSLMGLFPGGVQTPISPLGSKLQSLVRYCDLGFGIADEANFNLDVEGLSWSPANGASQFDAVPLFEMRLATSAFLPDEIQLATGFPQFPNSGLVANFGTNLLDAANDPQAIVHPRELGYVVMPGEDYMSATGTLLHPYPLNRGGDVSQYRYYTWRDTGVLALGGPNGAGATLSVENAALGVGPVGVPYGPGLVRSVGMPLLSEFRCFPSDGIIGLNAFDVGIANGAASTPNFRAFSTGGTDAGGNPVPRNPDLQTTALGGFNPQSMPPGAATLGIDNSFYFGELSFVTRVSRAHTLWFDALTAGPFFTQPSYAASVIEPRPEDLPLGTQVVIEWRGASVIGNADGLVDATTLDAYGDGALPTFVNGADWKASPAEIQNARYFQVRVTFISNTETGLTPELSSLGLAFEQ